jgi:hypothetical protein
VSRFWPGTTGFPVGCRNPAAHGCQVGRPPRFTYEGFLRANSIVLPGICRNVYSEDQRIRASAYVCVGLGLFPVRREAYPAECPQSHLAISLANSCLVNRMKTWFGCAARKLSFRSCKASSTITTVCRYWPRDSAPSCPRMTHPV